MALKRGTGGSIEGGLAGESSDINAKFENRVQQLEYDVTQSGGSVTALAARVLVLEVPPALLCDTATESWTTEAEADVTYAAGACTIGLDATTAQWPVGVSRPVNKVNLSAFGITLDPQPTHTINGVAAGTNVLLMNSATVPSGTQAAGVWRIKRLSATAWWVQ